MRWFFLPDLISPSLFLFCFGAGLLPLAFRGLAFCPADVENSSNRTLLTFKGLFEDFFVRFPFEVESWRLLQVDEEPDDESELELSINCNEPLSEITGLLCSHNGEDGTLSGAGL